MKIRNLKIFKKPNIKSKVLASSFAGIVLLTSLTGCGSTSLKATNSEFDIVSMNSVLLNFGDSTYALEVTKYTRSFGDFIEIYLLDGTMMIVDAKDIIAVYNNESATFNQIAKDFTIIKTNSTISKEEKYNYDRILLLSNGKVYSIPIKNQSGSSVPYSPDFCEFTLDDGSVILCTDFIAYNSESEVMNQIEEKENIKVLKP